ncbi:transcriptional antiterminator [Bacilli bacterium]|nr:transcriptional antiterminator [Bacilli bacterium]
MLTIRQEKLMAYLREDGSWLTGKALAYLMSVSDRTIRTDIGKINDFYGFTLIQSNRREGYRLSKREKTIKVVEASQSMALPQNANERALFLLKHLLVSKKEINLISFQQQVFISESTLENDLKKVRQILQDYPSLKLARSKNILSLKGSEGEKRHLYKTLLAKETKGNFLNLTTISTLFSKLDLMTIKAQFDGICSRYQYRVREIDIPMMMLHIGIGIERMLNRNFVSLPYHDGALQESIEYQIAENFYQQISKSLPIELKEEEIVLLAILLGNRNANFKKLRVEQSDDKSIKALVNEILTVLASQYDINFYKDEHLRSGLERHMRGLINRQENQLTVQNPYRQELKRHYPLIFDMAVRLGEIIEDKMHFTISENEIAFLAIHLGASYDTSRTANKNRTAIIHPDEKVLASQFVSKLESRFQGDIEIIAHLSYFEESLVRDLSPDLILTSLPLRHPLPITTVQLTLFVTHADEGLVIDALTQLDHQKLHGKFEQKVVGLIRPDVFYSNKVTGSETVENILSFMLDALYEKGYTPEDFKADVFKREFFSATSFAYGFAMPHSLKVMANESCLSVMQLDQPIMWGEYEVRLVLLIAISQADRNYMNLFFEWFNDVVNDPKRYSALLNAKDHAAFVTCIVGNNN